MTSRNPDPLLQGIIDRAMQGFRNGEPLIDGDQGSPGYRISIISPREMHVHVGQIPGHVGSRDFIVKIRELN
jgi:hypothetical protein